LIITRIEPVIVHVSERGDWVFVQVYTDDGLVGLGEASHGQNDGLVVAALRQCEVRLRGRDPREISLLASLLHSAEAGRAVQTAHSAVEQALWDLLGQSLGVPIRTLLGGARRDRIRLYANINRHVRDRSPAGFARAAAAAVAEGYTAVKLAPFDELREPDHVRTGPKAAWQPGVERVAAVRAAIGNEAELMVDCHGRMEASEAVQVARALAPFDLSWYEEPVPHIYHDELRAVTRSALMPTAAAESVYGVEGFAPFLCERLVDIIMPDVKHDGGIADTLAIAQAARMQHLLVAPHNPSGPVATAATAQVAATLSNLLMLEYAWGEVSWRATLVEPAERIEQGYLCLPDGAGLGHHLNDAIVREHLAMRPRDDDTSKVVVAPHSDGREGTV